MPAKLYSPIYDQRVRDKAQVGEGKFGDIAMRELIPRIAERNKQALMVTPKEFYFYQRSNSGRRCSCWEGIETSSNSQCSVCHGTGNTAGYQMWGWKLDVFDVTAQVSTVNVRIAYEEMSKPLRFALVDGAKLGYVDFLFSPTSSLGEINYVNVMARVRRGGQVIAGVKLFSEVSYVKMTRDSVASRVSQAVKNGGMQIRVVLGRDSISGESPKLSHVKVRYRVSDVDRILGDVPRVTEAETLSEYGVFDRFALRTMFIDNTLRSVTNSDFFKEVSSNRLWKITSSNPNAPADYLLSWDLDTRMVLPSEKLSFVP